MVDSCREYGRQSWQNEVQGTEDDFMAMDGDIDYSGCTGEELQEALARIQKDRFPINYERLVAEIEKRRLEAEKATPEDPVSAIQHKFEFRGIAEEYFKIWIVNLALTILTLGIYSAWAKVRKQRYFYSSTVLAGSSFGYHGDPLKILKGRIIAAVLFGLYFFSGRIFTFGTFYAVALVAILTPWLVVKSRTFAMRVTSWRGLRFDFAADYGGAYRALLGWLVLGFISLGLLMPRFSRERYRFIVTRSRFGKTAFECNPAIGRFYKTAIAAAGLTLAIGIFGGLIVAMIGAGLAAGGEKPASSVWMTYLPLLLYAVILPVVLGYTQSRNHNEVFEHTSIGPHQLHCKLSASRLIGIFFTNLLGMVFTLGLYTPWAQLRLARYRLECLELEVRGSLDDFVAATNAPVPAAMGEELTSFFDLDFGF
jgi:uncharacterized membrane protein YjgN (DUF898 family)